LSATDTGVARNFDWVGPKWKKYCDIILWHYFATDPCPPPPTPMVQTPDRPNLTQYCKNFATTSTSMQVAVVLPWCYVTVRIPQSRYIRLVVNT